MHLIRFSLPVCAMHMLNGYNFSGRRETSGGTHEERQVKDVMTGQAEIDINLHPEGWLLLLALMLKISCEERIPTSCQSLRTISGLLGGCHCSIIPAELLREDPPRARCNGCATLTRFPDCG